MLQGDFFTIDELRKEGIPAENGPTITNYSATVSLNASHPVFKGHFPGNPVVPGVCQVQMIKEVVEKGHEVKGLLKTGDNIKFLAMIVPDKNPVLQIECKVKENPGNDLDISATIAAKGQTFIKFKGTLCIQPS
jgi:3-hydroxyacyl-[acyl-carrier-protein] dehydratase